MCTSGDYLAPVLAPVLIAAHTSNSVDSGDEPENKNEGYESDQKRTTSLYAVTITTFSPDSNIINKMIESFKKAIRYILCYIVKYTSVVGLVVQEELNKEVSRKPRHLAFIPNIFKTQKMCNEAVRIKSASLMYVPDRLKTQEMCNDAVQKIPHLLEYVTDHFKTEEMCDDAVRYDPYNLKFIPDNLKT